MSGGSDGRSLAGVDLTPFLEGAVMWAKRFGATVAGCEHLWLAIHEREQADQQGPLYERGVRLVDLEAALAAHVGLTAVADRPSTAPQAFTQKAFSALERVSADPAATQAPGRALLAALLETPGWSGYEVLDELGVDASALRLSLGLSSAPPQAPMLARRPVTLPSGTTVWACPLALRREDQPDRDWGLYLDPRWAPTWPARLIDWPDFGVPREDAAAIAAIKEAYEMGASGKAVEVGCAGELGRTGVVLACLAVLDGVSAQGAVSWVRSTYDSRAVETLDQEDWVQQFPKR